MDGNALVYDFRMMEIVFSIKTENRISAVKINKEAGIAVLGTMHGCLEIWCLKNNNRLTTFDTDGIVTVCSILPDNRILCGTITGEVYLLKIENR